MWEGSVFVRLLFGKSYLSGGRLSQNRFWADRCEPSQWILTRAAVGAEQRHTESSFGVSRKLKQKNTACVPGGGLVDRLPVRGA
jgi:hypothetical protein